MSELDLIRKRLAKKIIDNIPYDKVISKSPGSYFKAAYTINEEAYLVYVMYYLRWAKKGKIHLAVISSKGENLTRKELSELEKTVDGQ